MTDNKILSLLFKNNTIRLVDDFFLKNCPFLADAKVFKRLFNLDENSPFGNYDLNTENGSITLPRDLHISYQSWDLLIHYLTYGYTLHFYSDNNIKRIESLEKTCHVCNVFGGIPYFDKFYNKFMETLESSYNPIKPINDTKCLYDWKVTTHYDFKNLPDNNEWNVTTCVYESPNCFYYRKLKEIPL